MPWPDRPSDFRLLFRRQLTSAISEEGKDRQEFPQSLQPCGMLDLSGACSKRTKLGRCEGTMSACFFQLGPDQSERFFPFDTLFVTQLSWVLLSPSLLSASVYPHLASPMLFVEFSCAIAMLSSIASFCLSQLWMSSIASVLARL